MCISGIRTAIGPGSIAGLIGLAWGLCCSSSGLSQAFKPSYAGYTNHIEIVDRAIELADSYGNSRVVKFDRDGRFLKSWGAFGSGPGEFNLPHSVAVDDKGHVYVADRENKRIQIFDSEGRFLRQWTGIGYPYGLFITQDQHVWVVDGRYDRVIELDPNGRMFWGSVQSSGWITREILPGK